MLTDNSHLEVSTAGSFNGDHPLPLGELKPFLTYYESDKDDELLRMVETVTLREQENLAIQIPTATYKIYFDGFSDRMEIPRPPVTSISNVTYLAADGTETVLASSVYRSTQLNQRRRPAVVQLAYNETWPTTREIDRDVWITFVCGWASGSVPADVKALIMHGVDSEFTGRDNEKVMERIRGGLTWTSAI